MNQLSQTQSREILKQKRNRNRNSGPKFALIALPRGPGFSTQPETRTLSDFPELVSRGQGGAVLRRLDRQDIGGEGLPGSVFRTFVEMAKLWHDCCLYK